MCRRHHLGGGAAGADEVTDALVGLHATDPASVYLAVAARSSAATVDDVAAVMYEQRSLVRWLAMRRTLFVFPTVDVPMIQVAASASVAAGLRTRLGNKLTRNGTDPTLPTDATVWVDAVADRVVEVLRQRGSATGAELGSDQPRLRTTILPRAKSDRPQQVTSSLLAMLSAQGRIVRGTPTGTWTTRRHRWEPVERWWPDGLPQLDPAEAERELVRRYLSRFGPATADDVQWWTGWSKATTTRALAALPVAEVDLHGRPGVIYDHAGNIGPTVWWEGEIVGSRAVAATGEVRAACTVDRGADAAAAVAQAAATLQSRLAGTVVIPAIRTPLERSLTQ